MWIKLYVVRITSGRITLRKSLTYIDEGMRSLASLRDDDRPFLGVRRTNLNQCSKPALTKPGRSGSFLPCSNFFVKDSFKGQKLQRSTRLAVQKRCWFCFSKEKYFYPPANSPPAGDTGRLFTANCIFFNAHMTVRAPIRSV